MRRFLISLQKTPTPARGAFSRTVICVAFLLSSGCAKFVIADRKKKAEEPPIPARTQSAPAGPAISKVVPPERIIKLTVAQVQPDAWWNSCMFLKVNDGAEVAVGCGKDDAQMGKVVELAAKKDFCNQISVRMKVTTGCPATSTCKVESWDRASSKDSDKRYFKFMEATKMLDAAGKLVDAAIRPNAAQQTALPEIQKQAVAHTAKTGNTWIRAWFEDQTDARYDGWIAQPAKFEELGIDWNDYAIDLKGEDVAFTIAGSSVACGAAGAAAAQPAGGGTGQPTSAAGQP